MKKTLALLALFLLVAPPVFFAFPQRSSAQVASALSAAKCLGLTNSLISGISKLFGSSGSSSGSSSGGSGGSSVPVSDMITRLKTTATADATGQDCIMNTILQPLARTLARVTLQNITSSTLNWINGSNSSGQVSYVQNLPNYMQKVGDSSALSFLSEFSRTSNSPFTASISSSLRANYLEETSSAGFFSANQDTLKKTSPDINAFLAGDWSKGGLRSWFALTTQPQNNPFALYQNTQNKMGSLVQNSQQSAKTEADWGRGFLSWCADGGSAMSANGADPKPLCMKDGTKTNTLTPGSIIHDYTQQAVLNSGINQLVSAQDIDSALNAVVSSLGKQILGTAGGLFGASQSSSGRRAFTAEAQNYSTDSLANSTAPRSVADTALANLAAYTSAWDTIVAAANTASASVNTMVSYCESKVNEPYASTAAINSARTQAQVARNTIAPIIAESNSAYASIERTRELARKLQREASDGTSAAEVAEDTQTLTAMLPTAEEMFAAEQNARRSGRASASPAGTLSVSGGTAVDQMNLISTNAAAMQSSCNPVAPVVVTPVQPGFDIQAP